MVRLVDLAPASRANIEALDCPSFTSRPWADGPLLRQRRVALISSAGLMKRGESTVKRSDAGYRRLPHDLPASDILMSHVSVNFDRTGFQQDLNVVLPRDRLDRLAAAGEIGSVAAEHFSFMGATHPGKMEPHARELAGRLKSDRVNAAVLLPV